MQSSAEVRELWPTEQAQALKTSLTEYLTTTFALSDPQAESALKGLLNDPDNGMFKGPYSRTRLPFQSSSSLMDEHGKPTSLDFYPADFPPYGHQAEAFQRLSSKPAEGQRFRTPEPTLVTTGTGSGKTEAFLFPILDHVLRAQRAGITGIKALVLYPMNALANDQAARITELLLDDQYPELSGVRAGLYTGEQGPKRTVVTEQGLINDRYELRDNPPDILLTNYKMLDQLLLRSEDAKLWKNTGISLQYLVLDEFHTYDGAQGTDVAMLLRRLGTMLKTDATEHPDSTFAPTSQELSRPLSKVTPVATSATMGGTVEEGGASPMLDFARKIFGVEFSAAAVIGETRLSMDKWLEVRRPNLPQIRDDQSILARLGYAVEDLDRADNAQTLTLDVLRTLFATLPFDSSDLGQIQDALKTHPWIKKLVQVTENAASMADIREGIVGQQPRERHQVIEDFIGHLLAVLSHIRSHLGRKSLTIETHLWVREVSRLDSPVDRNPDFLWSDDGVVQADADAENVTDTLPAIFCRHCGKRGWAALTSHDQNSVTMNAAEIRRASVRQNPNFMILLDGEDEATKLEELDADYTVEPRLAFFDLDSQTILDASVVDLEDRLDDYRRIVAVKKHTGQDQRDLTASQTCPNCDTPDAMRFVGSAIATLLSVAITGLFGSAALQTREKKALVFTDSVQDAAHRAGFIQARSHTFTLRTVLRQALQSLQSFHSETGATKHHLKHLIDAVIERAESSQDADKFLLIPPDVLEHNGFKSYWDPTATRAQHNAARKNVRRRLMFDTQLEVGLQARFGRTLELTGTIVVEADAGQDTDLKDIGQAALERLTQHQVFGLNEHSGTSWENQLRAWVRGVLIRIRLQGGIGHEWLERYWESHGRRWPIWGGRNRAQGMPAFPLGRSAPRFPAAEGRSLPHDTNFDPISTSQSWYTWWTRNAVGADREQAGHWIRALFDELVERDVLTLAPKTPNTKVYVLPPERLLVQLTNDADLKNMKYTLECNLCKAKTFGTERIVEEMTDAPCLNRRCTGELEPISFDGQNYYRHTLYSAARTTRVVAQEHTAMLSDELRQQYESEFRSSEITPTSPNVLVATPTLEMGIDIGTLSTVMLSSMPRSVANYIQRVGRAGRTSGNSLIMAFVQGRGQHLPKLNDPLSIINGQVTPPSTYLDANEILRRQFLAFCGDRLARQGLYSPRGIDQVLDSIDTGTYLGDLMAMLRENGEAIFNEFLGQFGPELTPGAQDRLFEWALPDPAQPDSDSQLESRLHRVSTMYREDKQELISRRQELENTQIPKLQQEEERALNTSGDGSDAHKEAKRALGIANGTARSLRDAVNQLSDKDWWIGGMERYGLFPNYTLLDETVELSARISQLNEDSRVWEADVVDFVRGASVALQEFAPGSKFYAQGMEFDIDAVELGPDHRHLAYWQVCPECGWVKKDLHKTVNEHDVTRYEGFVNVCGRCATANIGDTGQIIPIVELKKVSSEVRKDEARITDKGDEREQTSFHIQPTADLDPANRVQQWYLEDYPFGIELYSEADLNWYNFGVRSAAGKQIDLAGEQHNIPLFEICLSCGVQRTKLDINHEKDHRYWCEIRSAAEANTQSVALTRHLRTQAIRMHVASDLLLDEYSLPTLRAALLLGMREAFGGDPAHLQIMPIAEAQHFASQGYSADSLLLHDTVPGGTGYLSEFADADRMRKMLEKAYEVVSGCSCQASSDQRLACHNCLLPYAAYRQIHLVSRDVAKRVLGKLLASGREVEAPDEATSAQWQISDKPLFTEHRLGDSHLEIAFREALKERLEARSIKVTDSFKNGYLGYTFSVNGQQRKWRLEPQKVLDHSVKPDFVLSTTGVPPIAIFVDGMQYHATQAVNRVSDDVRKRHGLRFSDTPHIPWAITHQDIEVFKTKNANRTGTRQRLAWLEPSEQRNKFIDEHNIERALVQAAQRSSMDLLWEWINNPDETRFAALADYAVYAPLLEQTLKHRQPPTPLTENLAAELPEILLSPKLLAAALSTSASEVDAWWHHGNGPVDIAGAGNLKYPNRARVVLNLNDGQDGMSHVGFAESWRDWLLLATILSFREPNITSITSTSSAEDILQLDVARPVGQPPVVSGQWQELIEDAFDGAEKDLVTQLAHAEVAPPELGYETGDGLAIDIGWPDARVAVLLETSDDDDIEQLAGEGWQVLVDPEVEDVMTALKGSSWQH